MRNKIFYLILIISSGISYFLFVKKINNPLFDVLTLTIFIWSISKLVIYLKKKDSKEQNI
ncbi:hypothetical protein SAMN05660493_02036 [Epilithonimonas bovis DSM 19482]|uniref:Uncharacterized protein n=1 Tax=Epilithonimonas bovis DSM 19482 TaxID=1121284 RepID=A0A1U7PZG3_9FLAO|nr:hypothetical protein SAMN05660493_02036 [Epilithonimonas bovis DSM 19482]